MAHGEVDRGGDEAERRRFAVQLLGGLDHAGLGDRHDRAQHDLLEVPAAVGRLLDHHAFGSILVGRHDNPADRAAMQLRRHLGTEAQRRDEQQLGVPAVGVAEEGGVGRAGDGRYRRARRVVRAVVAAVVAPFPDRGRPSRSRASRTCVCGTCRLSTQTMSVMSTACGHLGSLVTSGEISPGTRLAEVPLASKLGVSRPTVREALRRLESNGLADSDGRSLRVAQMDAAELREHAPDALGARRPGAGLAAARVRDGEVAPAQLRRLVQLADDTERATTLGDHTSAIRANRDFHQAIDALADSPVLQRRCGRSAVGANPRLDRALARGARTRRDRQPRAPRPARRNRRGRRRACGPPRGPARPRDAGGSSAGGTGLKRRRASTTRAIDRGGQEPRDARSAATGSGLPLSHNSVCPPAASATRACRVRLADHEHAPPDECLGDGLHRLQVHAACAEHRIRVGDGHERAGPTFAQAHEADEVPDRPVRCRARAEITALEVRGQLGGARMRAPEGAGLDVRDQYDGPVGLGRRAQQSAEHRMRRGC